MAQGSLTFVGNQGNNAYRLCKWLRELNIDAVLYCFENPNERSDPKSVDQDFDLEASAWANLLQAGDPEEISRIETSSDAIITSGASGLAFVENFSAEKFLVHLSLGSEVTELPMMQFRDGCPDRTRPHSERALRSLQRVDQIITGFRPTMQTLAKLKLTHKTQICGYPEDIRGNIDRVDSNFLADLNARFGGYRRVFLWLSRLNFVNRELSDYKGPELFLNAFEKVREQYGDQVFAIVGEHGRDVEAFKQLIEEKGLADAIEFVPHLPYWKLLTYLSISNAIIVDELDREKGELSGMAREALSVGGVCIKSIDEELMRICHGDNCPILDAYDADSCHSRMIRLCEMSDDSFAQLQTGAREWAMRSLDYRSKALRYVELIRTAKYLKDVGSSID